MNSFIAISAPWAGSVTAMKGMICSCSVPLCTVSTRQIAVLAFNNLPETAGEANCLLLNC